MLFTFPSRYLFTVGHQLVFSLTPWSAPIHAKFHVCRITQEFPRLDQSFRLRAFHPLWRNFPEASPNSIQCHVGLLQPRRQSLRFGLFRFRSPLLTESHSFSFPQGTEMFHFPWYGVAALCIEGCTQRYEPLQVIPFGNLRVKASLPLSEAYRSLARPSSPAGAKAFTMCSKILDACSRWLAPASNKNLSLFRS